MNDLVGAEANDTLCVILHFGNPHDTAECLSSLEHEHSVDVVVVDNDDRQEFKLPGSWNKVATVVKTGGSMGFAEANNFGVREARRSQHRFIMLLNNDTVVKAGAISSLRQVMRDNRIGIVGPVMPYWDTPEKIWAAGGKVSKIFVTIDGLRTPPKSKITDVDYLPGAGFMTRIELWDRIGGLPERYFLAFEEAHYALEVAKLKYRVVVDAEATILHKVGMSSDRQPMYFYNTVRNRIRFGQYLHGDVVGGLQGALSALGRSYTLTRLRLWIRATIDEYRGKPLDRKTLNSVRDDFSANPE